MEKAIKITAGVFMVILGVIAASGYPIGVAGGISVFFGGCSIIFGALKW